MSVEQLTYLLKNLKQAVDGILDGFIITAKGVAAQVLGDGVRWKGDAREDEVLLISTLGKAAKVFVDQSLGGKFDVLILQHENGRLVLMEAGRGAILAVVAAEETKMDTCFVEMRKCAQNVAGLLEGEPYLDLKDESDQIADLIHSLNDQYKQWQEKKI